MKSAKLKVLKTVSLAILLPGLAGLIFSAMISTHYLDTLPRWPVPEENRVVPRGIHGITVYQTLREDQRLSRLEDSSIALFSVGLVLGVVYLEKWSSLRSAEEDEDRFAENNI